MNKEEWKKISDYPNYEISNIGNVRRNGICLKPSITNGYKHICLYNNGAKKTFRIHILVALHFVGGYQVGLVVNHKDKNSLNNEFTNLEWVTQRDNVRYSKARKVKSIDEYGNETIFKSIWDTRLYGYSFGDVRRACERGIKHKGLRWEYV